MSQYALTASRWMFLAVIASVALPVAEARVSEAYGTVPLYFEANRGQTHGDVRFLAHGSGYSLYLTAEEAVLVLAGAGDKGKACTQKGAQLQCESSPVTLRMSLVGAASNPLVSGLEEQPGKANYFIGRDASQWRTNVPTYAKVQYHAVYPGIDLVYYGNQRELEYDFVIAPGADPKQIGLDFRGAERVEIDDQGALVLHTSAGSVRVRRPAVYQEGEGIRREIAGGYVRKGANRFGFELAAYDPNRPLVIDPILSYATYLGGSEDGARSGPFGIAFDAAGNAYVVAWTHSLDFPTTAGAFQSTRPAGIYAAYVTKLDATGSALLYSTYLGGSRFVNFAMAIAVDADGSAYVTGVTESADFPTTPGAFHTTLGGNEDAFVTKLNPSGTALVYSTYLGGSSTDQASGIAVDAEGRAYVTGETNSTDFPTSEGAFQTSRGGDCCPGGRCADPSCWNDAFVTKLDATGSALIYSTYLGGRYGDIANGIAVDGEGNAYVAGGTSSDNFPTTPGAFQTTLKGGIQTPPFYYPLVEAFVTKLNAAGSALVYSTYLGGNDNEYASGIAVDSAGNAYVTGKSASSDFPTTPGAIQATYGGFEDAFVTKLDAAGAALVYSTYLGGSRFEYGTAIAVDSAANAYVTGLTASYDFPTAEAIQPSSGGGDDVYVAKINSAGSGLVYSTYLGGNDFDRGQAIAVDKHGNVYVTGDTSSTNFPTTASAFQPTPPFSGDTTAMFIMKIGDDSDLTTRPNIMPRSTVR